MKKIGVLNLQGAVDEHLQYLKKLPNIQGVKIKHAQDLHNLSGLIIPGGESTAISRLIQENELFNPIQQFAKAGNGILGTCAGLVLCAKTTTKITQSDYAVMPLQLMDMVVERNGFGRQVDSFEALVKVDDVGNDIPAIFIRAPYIASFGDSVTPLAYIDNRCVMARQDNILVCSFHPELTDDLRIIEYFVNKVCQP